MKVYILRVTDVYTMDFQDNECEDKIKLFALNFLRDHKMRDIPFKPIEHYIVMTSKQFMSDEQMAKIADMPNLFGLEELKGGNNGNVSSG